MSHYSGVRKMAFKAYAIIAKGLSKMEFDTLDETILACARLRALGYEPKLIQNPNIEWVEIK